MPFYFAREHQSRKIRMFRSFALIAALTLTACTEGQNVVVYAPGSANSPATAAGTGGFNGNTLTPINTAASAPAVPVAPPTNMPSDAQAAQFARAFLNTIQPESVARRAEMCGYFYIDDAGNIAATEPRIGSFAGCDMPVPRQSQNIFASYHTHSAFAPGYDNEVPSAQDLMSDFEFHIDGYVSTPGGRVWHVDYSSQETRQVCGLSCVYMDPGFRPVGEAQIRASYTVPALQQRGRMF